MPGKNGGTLMRGYHGQRTGPQPRKIRRRALQLLGDNIDVLGHIAAGATVAWGEDGAQELVTPKPAERVAAIKVLSEMALGSQVRAGEVRSRLREQLDVIRSRAAWTSDELIIELARVWR